MTNKQNMPEYEQNKRDLINSLSNYYYEEYRYDRPNDTFEQLRAFARDIATNEVDALLSEAYAKGVRDGQERLFEGGEKKFTKMLFEHGWEIGQHAPDFGLDTVVIRVPRRTIEKYFDGELQSQTKPLSKEESNE